jgi:hypothetical protein
MDPDYDPIINVAIFNYNHEFPWRIYPGGVDGSPELNAAIHEAEKEKKSQARKGKHCRIELTDKPPL